MRRLSPIVLVAAALLAAPGARAQTPPLPVTPAPVVQQTGKLFTSLDGGLATRRSRYYSRKGQVVVNGRSTAFAEGQVIQLEVVRRGRVVRRLTTPLRPVGRGGRFRFSFRAGRPGLRRLVVRHLATPELAPMRAPAERVRVVRWQAGTGARGAKVLILQRGLDKLGFATPVSGYFDAGTARAVTAFRKTNGLGRDGYALPGVYDRVLRGRGAFRLKYPNAGRHVEFDWSRQVLVLADRGRPRNVYHASSGKPSTPTVFGSFRFYRKEPGTNSHGMVHSNYFIGGYAIHGYPSVPTYPASHGCIRIPIPNALSVDRQIEIGERIFVYR